MANQMAASVLRNIISSVFNINPREVKFGEEISPNRIFTEDCGHSWASTAQCPEEYDTVYAYTKNGFVQIAGIHNQRVKMSHYTLQRQYKYSQNGELTEREGEPLYNHPDCSEFIFLLVQNLYISSNTTMSWTLYKAPNFKEHWDKIEEADIERWNKFLF